MCTGGSNAVENWYSSQWLTMVADGQHPHSLELEKIRRFEEEVISEARPLQNGLLFQIFFWLKSSNI